MTNLRRVIFCLILSLCAFLGGGISETPNVGRVEAGGGYGKLYYCDVQYTYKGRTVRGYIGGYVSDAAARYYFKLWAQGVAQYYPRLNRVYSE